MKKTQQQNNPKENRKKEKKKKQPKNRTNNVLSISVQLWFSLLLDISLVFLASYHVYKTTTASLCSEINFLSWFFFFRTLETASEKAKFELLNWVRPKTTFMTHKMIKTTMWCDKKTSESSSENSGPPVLVPRNMLKTHVPSAKVPYKSLWK